MKIKIKSISIEIELILIIVIMINLFSYKVFNYFKFFFISYMFILFHELAHIVVSSLFNIKLINFKMSICGVCAVFEEKKINKIKYILILLAGPFSNLFLALMFKDIKIIFELNIFLFILNILPIYPLDGSKIMSVFVKNKKEDLFNNIVLSIFFIISIYQVVKYRSFTFVIFLLYLITFKLLKHKYSKKY